MSDITFVTHLRYDHDDRINNFQTILNYYSQNWPDSKFIVVEDDYEHNHKIDIIKWPKNVSYYIIKNNSFYYRTRALNFGFKKANTSIVVSLDTDCIVPAESFNRCVEALQQDATIAIPYNGFFIDVSHKLHEEFKLNYNYNTLYSKLPPFEKLRLGFSTGDFHVRCTNTDHTGVGGIVMFHKHRLLEIGGYNEAFICWGAEDNELVERCKILEHVFYRDENNESVCFHLFHQAATRAGHPFYESNFNEMGKVSRMCKKDLQEYIKTWNQKNEQS